MTRPNFKFPEFLANINRHLPTLHATPLSSP
ncbi:Uncharacterised protein [Kingella negevensis]|uniref:Uncharacterized protein n=1 Tax=Kingella negevensis TaxID=1522312 RepID=A0A238HID3_9NEIS|nr:Uncharacterised protein [Kingella negevensis]